MKQSRANQLTAGEYGVGLAPAQPSFPSPLFYSLPSAHPSPTSFVIPMRTSMI